MVRRWQPCCSVIKPCRYESTQNSALFYLNLIKSTQHLCDTFFKRLNVSVSQSMVLLLQNCTIFGVSCLYNYSRFAKIRYQISKAMDYGIFVHPLLKTPADFFLLWTFPVLFTAHHSIDARWFGGLRGVRSAECRKCALRIFHIPHFLHSVLCVIHRTTVLL